MKIKRNYGSECKETVKKKASFRSKTVKLEVAGGTLGRRLNGFLISA